MGHLKSTLVILEDSKEIHFSSIAEIVKIEFLIWY